MKDNGAQVSALESLLARLMLAGVTLSAISLAGGLALWLSGRQATRLLDAGLITLLATPMLQVTPGTTTAVARNRSAGDAGV